MDFTRIDMDIPSTIHLQLCLEPGCEGPMIPIKRNPRVQASRSKDTWEMPRAPAVRRTDVAWRCLRQSRESPMEHVPTLCGVWTIKVVCWTVMNHGGFNWSEKNELIQLGNKLLQELGMNITKIETTSCQLVMFFVMYTSWKTTVTTRMAVIEGLAILSWIWAIFTVAGGTCFKRSPNGMFIYNLHYLSSSRLGICP